MTSNLPFDEWTSVLGSERLTGALLDRLTHYVHILEMNGESYRLATSKKQQQRHAKANISSEKGGVNPEQQKQRLEGTGYAALRPFPQCCLAVKCGVKREKSSAEQLYLLTRIGTLLTRHSVHLHSGIDRCLFYNSPPSLSFARSCKVCGFFSLQIEYVNGLQISILSRSRHTIVMSGV